MLIKGLGLRCKISIRVNKEAFGVVRFLVVQYGCLLDVGVQTDQIVAQSMDMNFHI